MSFFSALVLNFNAGLCITHVTSAEIMHIPINMAPRCTLKIWVLIPFQSIDSVGMTIQ